MYLIKFPYIILLVFFLSINTIVGQKGFSPEYIAVTNKRAEKIVSKMTFNSSGKKAIVSNLIASQYRSLSKIQDWKEAKNADVKGKELEENKEKTKLDKVKKKSIKKTKKLHKSYVKNLAKELSENQITQVKDGMTYGVVDITYSGYLDMLPNLTEEQKKMIYANLVEARELAMDGGSSKEKHAWFGKYKGRINNKLSADGYDLNKESADWHKRIEARKKAL